MKRRILGVVSGTGIVIGMMMAGCETIPPRQGTAIDEIGAIVSEGASQAIQPAQPPAEVTDALMPEVTVNIPEVSGEQIDQRFDIATNDMPAKQFFMSLVEGSQFNVIPHPDVQGDITLHLKNVTVIEVMNVVRDIYGYDYEIKGNVIEVKANSLQTRIFRVNYLNQKRSGSSEMFIQSGQKSSGAGGGGTEGTSSGTSGSTINTQSDVDFWKDVETSLKSILGDKGDRKIVVSPPSGLVIVRALPNELNDVENFLNSVQNIAARQVILEAKILEVELNDGFQAGINWAALGKPATGQTITAGQIGGGSVINNGVSDIAGAIGVLDPSQYSPIDGTATSAFGGMFALALSLNDFDAFVELLQTQGNVQVLSSPRVSTVNNQKAVIKVGSDQFFITNVKTDTTVSAGATTNTPTVEFTQFFSGVALAVTPQINEDGDVILHIHPSVTDVTDEIKQFTFAGGNFSVPLANSSIRESDSVIRAKNRQIVVIGGLMKNETTERVASVPLLGDIPFLGALFRHTQQVSRKSELVILLRPVVIDSGDNPWADTLSESADNFRDMNRGFHYGGKSEIFGTLGEEWPN